MLNYPAKDWAAQIPHQHDNDLNKESIVSIFRSGGQRRRFTAALSAGAVLALCLPSLAWAAPGDDDIARARAEEEAARMSVARIEVELATVATQAQQALQAAQIAAEQFNGARVALDQATAAAKKAQSEADAAQAEYEKGRQEVASVAQAAYRNGGSALDSLAPYLEAEGLRTVEARQATLSTFGNQANVKMQKVAALEQVADVMQKAADKALELQKTATAEVEARSKAAEKAANDAAAVQADTEMRRDVLRQELARKQNTTVELIEAKERAEAEARAAAEAAAAQRAAEEAARRREEARRREAEEAAQRDAYRPAPAPDPAPYIPPAPPSRGNVGAAQGAIDVAKSLLGSPYVWGGEGGADGGYDCSGLVTVAYRSQGIYLEHWSVAQYRYGASGGSYVPLSEAEPGDLVFWSSNGSASGVYHVAIYLGGGQIIEAATFGVPLRITGMYNRGSMMPYAVRVV